MHTNRGSTVHILYLDGLFWLNLLSYHIPVYSSYSTKALFWWNLLVPVTELATQYHRIYRQKTRRVVLKKISRVYWCPLSYVSLKIYSWNQLHRPHIYIFFKMNRINPRSFATKLMLLNWRGKKADYFALIHMETLKLHFLVGLRKS